MSQGSTIKDMRNNILLASIAGNFAKKFATELTQAGTTLDTLQTVFITTARKSDRWLGAVW